MKIGLIGYGKMGQIIDRLSSEKGMEVAARFDIDTPLDAGSKVRAVLHDVPVLIEFSTPDAVMENIEKGLALGKHMVVGTTGWQDRLDYVKKRVDDAGTGLVYASNFSLGVNLFYEISDHAGRIISRFKGYDPYLEEAHHQFKKDAPSGTALVIQGLIQQNYQKEIPISCVRAGFIPGTHSVSFDSRVDSIRIEHKARSREGFAEGALVAAEWIADHKGCFDFRDVLKDILQKD